MLLDTSITLHVMMRPNVIYEEVTPHLIIFGGPILCRAMALKTSKEVGGLSALSSSVGMAPNLPSALQSKYPTTALFNSSLSLHSPGDSLTLTIENLEVPAPGP